MAILVITNGKINDPSQTDEGLFGEQVNANGSSEIRLAWAEYKGMTPRIDSRTGSVD